MKNYRISNSRGVDLFVGTDIANDGKQGLIVQLSNVDFDEVQNKGFYFREGDEINEAELVRYARANNFDIISFDQSEKLEDLFSMDREMRFTVNVTVADTVFTLPASSEENDFSIDWGDGNQEDISAANPTHTYAIGTYQLKINGYMPLFAFADGGSKDLVVSLENVGDTGLETMNSFMYGCSNLVSVNLNNFGAPFKCSYAFASCPSLVDFFAETFYTDNVHNLDNFLNGTAIANFNGNSWNTRNVRTLAGFIRGNSALISFDANEWDLRNCESLSLMFTSDINLVNLFIGKWNVSKVKRFDWFCYDCRSLLRAEVEDWDVSSGERFEWMFRECRALIDLPVKRWNVSNARDMQGFILNCKALEVFNANDWDLRKCLTFWTFAAGCDSLKRVGVNGWKFAPGARITRMFEYCLVLEALNIDKWDISDISEGQGFARGCPLLRIVDTSNWIPFKRQVSLEKMFDGSTNLESPMNPEVFWLNPNVTNHLDVFRGCLLIENYDEIPNDWKGL